MAAPSSPPAVAPVLSTPAEHLFEESAPPPSESISNQPGLSDEQLALVYEIERTVDEIRAGRWRRIALQFPDSLLGDSPRIFAMLARRLRQSSNTPLINKGGVTELVDILDQTSLSEKKPEDENKIYILGDTSYGACCVDEIAAEHIDADVVVHYGRACLSPTARLPVIYVFTSRPLSLEPVLSSFRATYPSKEQKIVLMADIPYCRHIPQLTETLRDEGYDVFPTEIIHNPSSPIPNRTVPADVEEDQSKLRNYQLFHVAEPPQSLLLTLSSRLGAIHIYPVDNSENANPQSLLASSSRALMRRYAHITSLNTAGIFGILINTLSVKNYLHILSHVREQIAAAGKKSYTFVVGKLNPAKVANFSEIDGWVVIGCWESSLIEGKDFWKPVITPFELSLTLQSDAERVWTGEWTGDFQGVLEKYKAAKQSEGLDDTEIKDKSANDELGDENEDTAEVSGSEEESAPPEFDLRTGRYVSHSRPMRTGAGRGGSSTGNHGVDLITGKDDKTTPTSLIKRQNAGALTQIGGVVSPAAEYLRSKRTWQGLGTDFNAPEEEDEQVSGDAGQKQAATVEVGRSGIARGYTVGEDETVH